MARPPKAIPTTRRWPPDLGAGVPPAACRGPRLKFVVHLVGDLHEPMQSGVNINSGPGKAVLDQAYQQQSVPVVRRQIERAGLRLAQLINESLLP